MFYDHYRIHEAPLVLRQKLFSDSAGGALIGGAIASLAAKALPGPLGSALEFRFGRIISLNELCDKGEGSMNLGASSLSIQAWLFDDELDSLNVHDAQTIGDKVTAFHMFFYAGSVYEILHPYLQSLMVWDIVIKSRSLSFERDKVVVTLQLEATNTATEKLRASEPIVGALNAFRKLRSEVLAESSPGPKTLEQASVDSTTRAINQAVIKTVNVR
ncbi:MAG: hypothetical protein A2508_02590 [Candidatus Lambdaproteobacteria bacterium RIFOXYD12_FULL_49_8]|uniref:Uncharacterized protein n=1 Tax=Candidatus Lambdaproteobacteria bacterium RIFOXYD2_FULL_50_16 TaxID=1817772 RepID=A0A1F6G887_9PROT|nr:MAG: hypothetical protein A2527_00555 [Candidatus Lambdaproteobacteria bacterium RIFOXYD2_FULL_50_16]OGG98271.1 MAG: hypothetical protein A2508_02590 [Candidatus Lambdaproteobacteria bacterium RIFOXYD12_FULL_49_8]